MDHYIILCLKDGIAAIYAVANGDRVNNFGEVKPEECKCQYPYVIYTTTSGHDEKCPVHKVWVEILTVFHDEVQSNVSCESESTNVSVPDKDWS